MKPQLIFLALFLSLSACSNSNKEVSNKPEWVIEEDKMVDIIVDLRIADAAVYINSNSAPRDKVKDWNFIMKKHHTSDSIFLKSHDYYAEHPEVAESIYESVEDKLNEMLANNTFEN